MRRSRCVCEGISSKDEEKYQKMLELVELCNELSVEADSEVLSYIDKFNRGEQESTVSLRPGIDKGVNIKTYMDEKVILIDLSEIPKNIDMIRIKHEEFEE